MRAVRARPPRFTHRPRRAARSLAARSWSASDAARAERTTASWRSAAPALGQALDGRPREAKGYLSEFSPIAVAFARHCYAPGSFHLGATALEARPDLLIFDCDGVLVDSEPISCAVLAEALSREGVPADVTSVKRHFLGRSLRVVRPHALEQGIALPEDFEARLNATLLARFREELQPIPGVAELLEAWGPQVCVASSSHLERVRLCLHLTGLDRFFGDRVYTAEMVRHGKPAPDLFLHAAAQLGAAPARCLVLEDSPSGVRAAQAAQMEVWGFTGGAHHAGSQAASDLLTDAGATRVLDDMRGVADALDMAGTTPSRG